MIKEKLTPKKALELSEKRAWFHFGENDYQAIKLVGNTLYCLTLRDQQIVEGGFDLGIGAMTHIEETEPPELSESWREEFGVKTTRLLRRLEKEKENPVSPSHYKGEIEAIDAIKVATKDLTGIQATDTGNVIKYMWRWKKKNGVEDLKKAKWYLEHLIKEVENET